jgi:hypothetical protein
MLLKCFTIVFEFKYFPNLDSNCDTNHETCCYFYRYQTAIRISEIPREAFLDQGIWYYLFRIKCFADAAHGPMML